MDPLTIASFCTGYGGLDLGVHQCARSVFGRTARTVLHVEREAFCAELLASRMDEEDLAPAPLWSDLTTLDGRLWRGVVDCVIAGIPCQGNSLAGKRLLSDDPRDLWPPTRRLLREMEPRLFFLENVYGFVVPDRTNGRTAPIARVLGELAADGWDAEWIVLPASAVGAPHTRERLFLLAVNRNVEPRIALADDHRGRRDRRPQEPIGREIERVAPQRTSPVMVNPLRGGGCEPIPEPAGDRDGIPPDALRSSVDVVHTKRPHERSGPARRQGRQGQRRSGPPDDGRELGDARRELPQGVVETGPACGPTRRASRATLGAFPPGPNDHDAWARILALRPDLAPAIASTPESEVRRVAHGRAGRMDRLRALGNGVVPAQAAHALTILAERLL